VVQQRAILRARAAHWRDGSMVPDLAAATVSTLPPQVSSPWLVPLHLADLSTHGIMTGPALADKTPLERTIESWGRDLFGVAGAGSAAAFLQGRHQQQEESGRAAVLSDDEECWEASLRRQNAANDERSSENGRLRAEIDRLQAEEWALAATEAAASDGDSGGPEQAEACERDVNAPGTREEEELLQEALAAVQDALAQWVAANSGDDTAEEDEYKAPEQQPPRPDSEAEEELQASLEKKGASIASTACDDGGAQAVLSLQCGEAWQVVVVASVDAVMRGAFRDIDENSMAQPTRTREEEFAVGS